MCEDSANLDKIYQYKISKICHSCSNNACFTWKRCCEARGCTNFQITDQLCNCKHIVCKMLHIILLLDVSMTLINNLHLGIYRVSQKKGNPFYQWDIFIVAQVFIELYASCSRAFSILSFDTKHMTISQYMTEKEQFELMHVKIELRRIMVLSWYDQVQTS